MQSSSAAKRTRRATSVENPDEPNSKQSDKIRPKNKVSAPAKRTRRATSIENRNKPKSNQSTKDYTKPGWMEMSESISTHSEIVDKCLEMDKTLHEEKNHVIFLQQKLITITAECIQKEKPIVELKKYSAQLQEKVNDNVNLLDFSATVIEADSSKNSASNGHEQSRTVSVVPITESHVNIETLNGFESGPGVEENPTSNEYNQAEESDSTAFNWTPLE